MDAAVGEGLVILLGGTVISIVGEEGDALVRIGDVEARGLTV